MPIESQEIYKIVFKDYPDILDVKQVSKLLNISIKTVYKLIKAGSLPHLKVGREFRIAKFEVMKYLNIIDSQEETGSLDTTSPQM